MKTGYPADNNRIIDGCSYLNANKRVLRLQLRLYTHTPH
jgi:hypothetical protein